MTNLNKIQEFLKALPRIPTSRIENVREGDVKGFCFSISSGEGTVEFFIDSFGRQKDATEARIIVSPTKTINIPREGLGDVFRFIVKLYYERQDRKLEKIIRILEPNKQ